MRAQPICLRCARSLRQPLVDCGRTRRGAEGAAPTAPRNRAKRLRNGLPPGEPSRSRPASRRAPRRERPGLRSAWRPRPHSVEAGLTETSEARQRARRLHGFPFRRGFGWRAGAPPGARRPATVPARLRPSSTSRASARVDLRAWARPCGGCDRSPRECPACVSCDVGQHSLYQPPVSITSRLPSASSSTSVG